MSLYDQLVAYCPFNEQEEKDKQVFLTALERDANCFRRSAQAILPVRHGLSMRRARRP